MQVIFPMLMLILKNIKTTSTYLELYKSPYRINKRNLQRQTFKTKERIKKSSIVGDYEKVQNNLKITPPSIFSLPMEEYVPKLSDFDVNNIYTLLNNPHVKYSYDLFNNLYTHLTDMQQTTKKELYIETEFSPRFIKDSYKILTAKDPDYKIILDIITKYNINVAYIPYAEESKAYIYFSLEGAYEVDKFLQKMHTTLENNNHKFMAFSEKFFKNEVNVIFKKIQEEKENLQSMKLSLNKTVLTIIYDTLAKLDQGHLSIFIRCLATLLFKEGDISSEINEPKTIITSDNRTFFKLHTSYGGVISRLGEMFISSYQDKIIPKKDFLLNMTELLTYIYNNDKPKSINRKKTIKNLINTKTLTLNHKIVTILIDFYCGFKTIKVKKSFELRLVNTFVKQQMIKIFAIIGEVLIKLLSNVIYINKEDESSIYILDEFYWITKQSGKYPFFGIKQTTIKDIEETIDETKHKFIYKSLSYTYNQPMINYSSKYHLQHISENFVDQIQNSSNSYVCKLNMGAFIHFLTAVNYFIDRKGQINDKFLKYLLPKETDLNILKYSFTQEQFEKFIDFICDLSKLSYEEFKRNTQIYDIKPLIIACISYKLEIIQLLRILWPIIIFSCWYPRVWADARGRQYPYEMPLNITKSPKWRSLFQYITYIDTAQNTQDHLDTHLNILKMEDSKLQANIDVLEQKIANNLRKHYGKH